MSKVHTLYKQIYCKYNYKFYILESPVVGISSSHHRVIFDVVSSYVEATSVTTSLFVRVRSSESDSVFFYTAHTNGDSILLQLTNGRIAASVDLGSGSVTIATKANTYNDNQWHRVKLERVKRSVNLTVDNSDSSTGTTLGAYDKFSLPKSKTSFILSGLGSDNLNKNLQTVDGRNFTGCLQELVFNGYDLFRKYNKSAKEITLKGKFSKTCPKPTTMPPTVATTLPKIATTVAVPSHTSILDLGNSKTKTASGAFSVTLSPTTSKKVPCIVAGIFCENTTAGVPTSQAHTVTSSQVKHVTTSSSNQSWTGSDTSNQPTVSSKKTTENSSNTGRFNTHLPSTNSESISQDFSASKKVTEANAEPRTTDEVITASQSGRKEGDLTIYFVVAAAVGLLAFLLAILIIVKVNWASKKKYAVRGRKYEQDYWADTGSFQRATKESKPLV